MKFGVGRQRKLSNISAYKITQNSYCTLLWRARGAQAYNGGLGAEPPAGSRGRGGQGGEAPLKLKTF